MMQQGSTLSYTRSELIASALAVITYVVGAAGFSIPLTHELFRNLVPFIIILSLIVSFSFQRNSFNSRIISVFAAITIISWLIEAIGVNSGIIFGKYAYGNALGFKLYETPLIIGFNWLSLVYCSAALVNSFNVNTYTRVIFASSLMVLYDLVLEVVAPVIGMWHFNDEIPPLLNYIAWFILSVIFHAFIRLSRIEIKNRVAPVIFIIQFIFFLILLIINRLQ